MAKLFTDDLNNRIMFSFMLTDEKKPLRRRKHCQSVFMAARPNAAFCSPRCKNQYSVYTRAGRAKRNNMEGNDMNDLVSAVKNHVDVMFKNADIMLRTCNLDFILCDFPIWKHVYHMLHSCDQWFINPNHYEEPDFHEPNLNSLNVMTQKVLSRDDLLKYLDDIHTKIENYLDSLTDETLYELPQDCAANRLSLILSQQRHFYAHLGNINATTIIETNEWPRVIGITGKIGNSSEGLFE